GDERFLDRFRNLGQRDERAAFESELGDEASVVGEELGCLVRRERVELTGVGARAAAADEGPRRVGKAAEEGHREGRGEQQRPRETRSATRSGPATRHW